ncbi:hypothetical protein PLICRDRAFT_93555 [Plicaturopsis crispa FD-325 SS-3]|nr:hypothetical protein PLICRDRAFT_93555 [Plicaturopsis crispa FD-325 SS-3]
MSIDLTLERIRTLTDHLPPYTRPTCHIAGTNGKGSVSALLTSIFLAASPPLLVGRFNSPHLLSVRDCITINNVPVTQSAYISARDEVTSADTRHAIGASSFETLTLTALRIFEAAGVDVVVMEVGMGGRLDATNVIPDACVLVSALTAVDLDHQAFLGTSVDAIAAEKAAIARPGKPFVLGPQAHKQVEDVVRSIVGEAGGRLILAKPAVSRSWDETCDGRTAPAVCLQAEHFQGPPPQPVAIEIQGLTGQADDLKALLPLYGAHQLDNLGIAGSIVSALLTHPDVPPLFRERITLESVARGIKATRWPGRLSFHVMSLPSPSSQKLLVLADGAHNPASSATLAAYIASLRSRSPITYILALSRSPPKTPLQTLSPLLIAHAHPYLSQPPNIALVRFTQPEGMPWVRSEEPQDVAEVVKALVPAADVWCSSGEDTGLKEALDWAAGKIRDVDGEGLVVVAGSLYLVADFYRLLGGLS